MWCSSRALGFIYWENFLFIYFLRWGKGWRVLYSTQGQILHYHFIMALWHYGFFNQQIQTLFIHRCIFKRHTRYSNLHRVDTIKSNMNIILVWYGGRGGWWINETLFIWRTRGGNGKKGPAWRTFIPALTPRLFPPRDFYSICPSACASLSVSLSESLVLDWVKRVCVCVCVVWQYILALRQVSL